MASTKEQQQGEHSERTDHSDSDDEHEDSARSGAFVQKTGDTAAKNLLADRSLISLPKVNLTPAVYVPPSEQGTSLLPIGTRELNYNPRYEDLFRPAPGPQNPFRTEQQRAARNILSGYVEPSSMSAFTFESQRRTFNTYGYAADPSLVNAVGNYEQGGANTPMLPVAGPGSRRSAANRDGNSGNSKSDDAKEASNAGSSGQKAMSEEERSALCGLVGDLDAAAQSGAKMAFENASAEERRAASRKRARNNDPGDVDGYAGPWAAFADEKKVAVPDEDERRELEEILQKRAAKKGRSRRGAEAASVEEKSTLHVNEAKDYQGRSFMQPPPEARRNVPDKCYLPKRMIWSWDAHSNKCVNAVRWLPNSAHLLLSCGADARIKLFEVYGARRLIRTYAGHGLSVRDVAFDNAGTQFLSASYDRHVKLWDTESGKCVSRFTNGKTPYCVRFNPDADKNHLFVAGMSDKKIVCWDTRSGEAVQEYDRHLGAVNSVTFVDSNRRFVSTSDDNSLRMWEWDIPVDFHVVAEPTMHSLPAVAVAPNGKFLACQSMDNQIISFNLLAQLKPVKKKTFKGHMVAGYACALEFSPDGTYIMSGDGDGKLFIWDWKSTRLRSRFKAHNGVCFTCAWHPHESSRIATAGWDGLIKLWD